MFSFKFKVHQNHFGRQGTVFPSPLAGLRGRAFGQRWQEGKR